MISALAPGTVLSKDNWQGGTDALPAELLQKVRSGALEVRIQETTDLPVSGPYVEATRKYASQTRLREDGSLDSYVAGRPFPVIDPSDPQAGTKMAWNDRYRDFGNGAEAWGTFRQLAQSGRVMREIEFYYAVAYGMHRDDESANRWKKDGILFKEFYQCLAPFDLKNVMNLKYRHDDDRDGDIDWVYSPQDRRVRKLVIPLDQPTMGSEFLYEDFFGFSGYVHAHDWKFLGRKTVLAPVGVRSATAAFTTGSYPADAWQPRKMLVLESTPKDPGHPYGRRILYVDEQMGVSSYVLIYDKQGNHYKTLFTVYGDPAFSPGNERVRVPVWLGNSVINHATGRTTIGELSRVVFPASVPEDTFEVSRLLERGR